MVKIIDESDKIRQEMKEMTNEQLKSELSKLCMDASSSSQRKSLYQMELQTRILWEKRREQVSAFIK